MASTFKIDATQRPDGPRIEYPKIGCEHPLPPWNIVRMNDIRGSGIEKIKARSNPFIREASLVATVQRKPPLVPPQVPRKRLPWLDGKPPSIKPTTRPARKPSVPGSFISEGDTTPASEQQWTLSLTYAKNQPKAFSQRRS